MSKKIRKVFVGMSGGVDSSVSAALLQSEGYDVVGVFIKVWQADFLPCTWREERRDAMRAAAHLGIPFLTLDLEHEYKKGVVDYMIQEYSEGRVPNPDVMCNKHVKFRAFLDFAKKNGADAIATGHYARVERDDVGMFRLYKGVDQEKDQSYFLWTLDQEQLAHAMFPVGHLEKSEVRRRAQEFGLPNAQKKDSQGLCFMGAIDMKDFLMHYLHTTPGMVLDRDGAIIGTHDGAMLYTIGQRHGFVTTKQSAHETPLFVVRKDVQKNTITVAAEVDVDTRRHHSGKILLKTYNWIPVSPDVGTEVACVARVRYRGVLQPVVVKWITAQEVSVTLSAEDEFIAAGQSMVFYEGDRCLGGGIIE